KEENSKSIVTYDNLAINLDKYEVTKNGEVIELTLREFELLKFLAISKGQVFSRETLLEKVWGYEYYGDIRTVDVTVRRLREKIEDDPSRAQYILTKRGIGYYFKG
ncbi:MAG: response regulator transcription factor, partial [Epulopiscium sp.]|nr:response regulator transcription factor [Candidatus Epulonipiscium sp.]